MPDVLIIDDNVTIANMIMMSLDEVGLTAHYIISASEAEQYYNNEYRVIVADIHLGGETTGFDVAEKYMQRHLKKVKTIIYSAYPIDPKYADKADIVYTKDIKELGQLIGIIKGICMCTELPEEIHLLIAKIDELERRFDCERGTLTRHESLLSALDERTKLLPDLNAQTIKFIQEKGIQGDQLLEILKPWKIALYLIGTILTIMAGVAGIVTMLMKSYAG